MIENKTSLLVQLNVNDLQQLIQEAVKNELENLKNLIKPISKDSENESNIISREEVSKLLKISYCSLYHWNKKGILKAKKIGSRVYYLKSDVMSKLNQAS
ncbi:AlpA family transcriptional regulator [Flavobacterium sp. HBTb2-11-1]|uniref:helix-turn-helix transcriptional regulator n=1 Tax=Flavobacterium sp. HBTb2-11-1 TaxID=2692212 RepID=UPI001368FFA1|nr:helix-turn-helix domain-containing protein [Flavobacterium sp. HBTb2-11-1]MXO06168.1 helix-turn-helix domain-containing protein [Flavobacterium sp. HBTb2-11-1]